MPNFSEHLETILGDARSALSECDLNAVIIHSGTPRFYTADDVEVPFRATPHFKRFAPLTTPHHFLIITEENDKPILIEVEQQDFWEEYTVTTDAWKNEFEYVCVADITEAERITKTHSKPKTAFIGDTLSIAQKLGIEPSHINPDKLIKALDEARSIKTPYEISCVKEANARASVGHIAGRDAFLNGASELDIHYAFLGATRTTESELPYPTIVALNEKSSILHYNHKRDTKNGSTFLLDAGIDHNGYASDITRTYTKEAHPVFESLLAELEILQQKICALVKPNAVFIELHHEAHLGIAHILHTYGITTKDGEDLITAGITKAFLPHGLGHMLGLQVHDVGGSSDEGFEHPLRELYPKIRTNKILMTDAVTTIEPGIYFIPMLLEPFRTAETKNIFNWKLIDELIPCGGIRIEDNLVVTKNGNENLTREYLP